MKKVYFMSTILPRAGAGAGAAPSERLRLQPQRAAPATQHYLDVVMNLHK
jgi:hypothetical protein